MATAVEMRSTLVLWGSAAGKPRSLRSNVLRMKKLLFLRTAQHVDIHMNMEPGVLLRSFQFLDTDEQSEDPVQEWGEEVEDGAVFGITLHREAIQPNLDTMESPKAFSCIQYRTAKVRRLKAATLERLVAHLLDCERREPDFTRVFLSTYRAFTSTRTLIELLLHRDDSAATLENSVCPRSTLIPLLRLWLEEYSEDFYEPPQHQALRLLCAYLRRRICFRRLAQTAESLFKRLQEPDVSLSHVMSEHHSEPQKHEEHRDEEGSGDRSNNGHNFIDFPAKEVAEQLTRLDTELFVRVVPFHCLGCVWSNRDKKGNQELAPTVRATIAQFNAVTSRVITSLLRPPTPNPATPCPVFSPNPSSSSTFVYSSTALGSPCSTHPSPACRARVIEWWVAIAQECRQLKNFSSLRAILSALQSNAIYRLKKTWAAVSREYMSTFDQLCETFPDENCVLTSREILLEDGSPTDDNGTGRPKSPKLCPISRQMTSPTGVVPYLGTYLTVLTMLDTALADTVEGGLINFEKRRREFEILSQICQFQASCSRYSLPVNPDITAWLKAHTLLTDQESYELSRHLEPPVDPCPGSPSSWSHRLLNKKFTSLRTANETPNRKKHADQISVSSSGSSGSDLEEVLSPQRPLRRLKLQPLSGSLRNVSEDVSSTSSSSMSCLSPNSSHSSFSSSNPDLSSPLLVQSPENVFSACSSRASLPVYNKQVADSCIVRVSVECGNNGNIYKSILLTSQDHTAHVIQRALEKHNMEGVSYHDFSLSQVLNSDKELQIPDKANVFYAMCTTANYDFILRQRWRSHGRHLGSSSSPGAQSRSRHAK